ncbi:MAG: HEAT repeat domain-containing protein, partial [Gammaproteobacteria bacterium]
PEVVADALVAALETAGRDLKLPLIRALAACGREKSGDVLLSQLADNDGFVRAEAVCALFRQGPAGPEIETLLDDPDPWVRLRAAEAVAGTGGAGAVRLLVDFAFSFEGCHARQTAGLLRNLDATAASAAFAKVLRDRERRRVWSVAIEALEELNRSQPAAA